MRLPIEKKILKMICAMKWHLRNRLTKNPEENATVSDVSLSLIIMTAML
jgi:hypothetical protein